MSETPAGEHSADKDATPSWVGNLLDGYDPVPGLVARGVMSVEHDPDSCEYECCIASAETAEGSSDE